MRNICFLPHNRMVFNDLAAIAVMVGDSGRARPIMLLPPAHGRQWERACRERGLDCLLLDAPDADPSPPSAFSPGRLWRAAQWRLGGEMARFRQMKAAHRQTMERQAALLDDVLRQARPAAVVTADERSVGWVTILLARCRDLGIPSLVTPSAYVADKESLLLLRKSPLHHTNLVPELARDFPEQVAWDESRGRELFFYPCPVMAAMAEMGVLPPRPWVPGGGLARVFMADGQQSLDRFLAQGADPAKLLLTGHRSHDELHRAAQEAPPPGGRRLVASMPQWGEDGTLGPEDNAREIRSLAGTLSSLEADCVASLHPRMDPAAYDFLSREFGMAIAARPLSQELPGARVFTASFSSTVTWAVMCGIPTVVFDFFNFDFKMYDFLTGVKVVRDHAQLGHELRRLLEDQDHWRAMAREQKTWAAYLSPFDGRCGQRIRDAILDAAGL